MSQFDGCTLRWLHLKGVYINSGAARSVPFHAPHEYGQQMCPTFPVFPWRSAMSASEQTFRTAHPIIHLACDLVPVFVGKKKRGRPSKKTPDSAEVSDEQEVQKKKRNLNRFDGLSVEEVMSRTLPDVIEENLDILIIGINPGLLSAYKGHHYPNPGNHFWKCLFLSGLTDKQLNFLDDTSLPQKHGIGFTNMVERTTPGSKDLSSKEIREGGKQLLEKLQKYRPLIAAFNGKGKDTLWNLSSVKKRLGPRCAQFPRAQDKVHFYIKLKELRDGLKGAVQSREVEETHYTFDLQLAKEDARLLAIKEEQVDPEYESYARDLSEPNTDTKR
uniref:G/T mismatch-specific thymine DNA glycosylase n=1 Tax=Periophthalmus magnuspinnatus TaxID=409849 RepID=A0A3B3ZI13_9GOBI